MDIEQFKNLANVQQKLACNILDTLIQVQLIKHYRVLLTKTDVPLSHNLDDLSKLIPSLNTALGLIGYSNLISKFHSNTIKTVEEQGTQEEIHEWFNSACDSFFENSHHLAHIQEANPLSYTGALILANHLIQFAKRHNLETFRLRSRLASFKLTIEQNKNKIGDLQLCTLTN